MLFITGFDHLGDVDVALVGDDAFRVVVQLFFSGGDVGFDVLLGFRRDLQLFKHLVVPFKHLDGVPALLFFGLIVDRGFFDMRQRVFHRTGEGMLGDGLCALRGLNRLFGGFHNAGALEGGDLDDLAS